MPRRAIAACAAVVAPSLLLVAVARPRAPEVLVLEDPARWPREPPCPIDLLPLMLAAPGSVPQTRSYASLWPLTWVAEQTGESEQIRLYDDEGRLDEAALSALDRLLADGRRPGLPRPQTTIDRRLLRLVVRTAYHFDARTITVVSAYRRPIRWAEGHHGKGRAIDFRLDTADQHEVADYLRSQPLVGVGEYLHPQTLYVHLDVRDRSYHWVDRTGPRRRWGEVRLRTEGLEEIDATYDDGDDRPEGL